MQEYDITLKLLLKGSATETVRELCGAVVTRWLDVELPKVQNLRLDLLGETADGSLIHIELQSSNDPAMPLRMAEYCLGVYRLRGQLPRQVVLYVGEAPLTMQSVLCGPGVLFEYRLIDIRDLDADRLLGSEQVGDNVIAILARLRDDREAVQRILQRVAGLAVTARETALAQLTILAGLRHLWTLVEQEIRKMPIDIDIREHELLGPMLQAELQKGMEQGMQQGLQQGMRQGVQQGELTIVRRFVEKRFGALSGWAIEKLASLSASELEELSSRLLDANSLEELFR